MDREVCQIAVELKKEDLAFAYEAMGKKMTDKNWKSFRNKLFGAIEIKPIDQTRLSVDTAQVLRGVIAILLIRNKHNINRIKIKKQ